MKNDSEHLEAARSLRAALDSAAEGLMEARLDELLAAERGLATALAAWPCDARAASPVENRQLRQEVHRLRASLDRCRRLGLALESFAQASLGASGCPAYDSGGVPKPRPSSGRSAWEARA